MNSNIKFAKKDIDFDQITYNIPKEYTLKYSNNGEETIKILEIETTCECTAFKWDKQPIDPGEVGSILIIYSPKYPGHFKEFVRVFTNSSKDNVIQLTIKGRVVES
ncbi:MAG TPA: DUF1573 domain-containing protein [Chitinophagaceae bacterium]|nr:DUF1573 domain-containing protein [Chitinophagaceae bacterium]